ncbi:MAG: murein L,D-transpeptidase [Steroidobacteraceae bacterium]
MRCLIRSFCLNLLFSIVLVTGTVSPASAQQPDTPFAVTVNELLRSARHPYLQQGDLKPELADLQQLYQQRSFAPLWYRQNQPTAQALEILHILRDAAAYGLRATDYEGTSLTYRLTEQATTTSSLQEEQQRAQFDVALSTVVLRFIKHLHYGRIDPHVAGFELKSIRSHEFDPAARLATLAGTHDLAGEITQVEPQYQHYQLLKAALTRYRQLAMDESLTQLPGFKERSIKPGNQYAGAPALRRLLAAEQDLAAHEIAADSNTSLDPALVKALQNYQQRHGLQADGALGKQTFTALTTPFAARVRQIELTLERWRWLPPLQSPMIVVNIPQFRLFAFKSANDREASLLRMDVIVGQSYPHTQTPVFLADMKYVVFRPYWDVPYNITRRELLPDIRRNPDYLRRNEFELVRGQGDNSPVVPATAENIAQLATGAIRVRQRPGVKNALGNVKFMLPNNHNVYLHSTPAQHLFAASRRAFSHGCIRVSDPVALAEYVLRNAAEEWDRGKIQMAMQGEPNQRVYLDKPIPVLIVYGTAMASESGQVQFFDDIYGYDQKLAQLLGLPLSSR